MTPLIDIMLVLLIIFLATSSITLESGLDIEIPKTKFETQLQDPESIVISVSEKGEIYVQGKIYSLEEMQFVLNELLRGMPQKMIVLEGDQRIHLGLAIEIMDIARSAGAEKFAIAAQENP